MKYVIEHLEPRLYNWCLIEYENISKIVGKENLIFTRIKKEKERKKLLKFGKVYKESISELPLKNKKSCLLDLNAKETLTPEDGKKFDFLVFGGILGDNPPRQRTKKELGSLKAPKRNLGKKQMPTDNAVYVARKIISGIPIDKIKFIDDVEIDIKEGESILLPFRFVAEKGKPLISEKLVDYIKRKKEF